MLRAVFVNHWSLSCWSLLVTRNSHGVPFQQKHLDICLYEATMGSHERRFGCSRPQPPAWSTRVCFRQWSCVDHIAPARCIKAFVCSQSHCDRNETLSTPTYYFIAQNIQHLENSRESWAWLRMSKYVWIWYDEYKRLHGTMGNSTRQNMPQVFKIHLLVPETATPMRRGRFLSKHSQYV